MPRTKSNGKHVERHVDRIRFAVVGLGHIAQSAMLPAFAHATENCRLGALVSGDPVKRKRIAKKYAVKHTYSYDDYDACLEQVDAVYIALPNSMHAAYAKRAAQAGVHVLCEKPLAVTTAECDELIQTCRDSGIKAMVAYRLHLEEATREAAKVARSGQLGELRAFHSTFTMTVKPGNIRLDRALGGGPLYDIGIYVINAARMIFDDEPQEVAAFSVRGRDRRFTEVDEMTSAVLRYPRGCLATFTASFGAADASMYEVVGTKGKLRVEPAYEYAEGLAIQKTVGDKTTKQAFAKCDQFAPELIYFADCIRTNRDPEPSFEEGLNDIQIIEALQQSASTGRAISLAITPSALRQPVRVIKKPPVRRVKEIHASSPTAD